MIRPALPCADARALKVVDDRLPLSWRLVRAIDAQEVRSGLHQSVGPGRGGIHGVGRGHHDVHVAVGRRRPEQRASVFVQQCLGLCPVEGVARIRRVTALAREPGAQPTQGVAHMSFAPPERREPHRRKLELQRADLLLTQAEVVREIRGAASMFGQGCVNACAVARLLRLDRRQDREEVLRIESVRSVVPPGKGSTIFSMSELEVESIQRSQAQARAVVSGVHHTATCRIEIHSSPPCDGRACKPRTIAPGVVLVRSSPPTAAAP